MALKLVGLAWMGGKFLSSFKLYFVSLILKKRKDGIVPQSVLNH